MNILFLSGPNINPHDGGVARITHTLANEFVKKGYNVWYLGYRQISEDDKERQFYFPVSKLESNTENLNYLESVLVEKRIDVVIVQHNPCEQYIKMLHECKMKHNFKIVSCFHNLILTQIYNYAYVLEYDLKKRNLFFLFSLLKTKCVRRILTNIYILKYRKLYRYVVDKSDISVVLCEGHKKELLEMIGRKEDESIKIIPNCCNELIGNRKDKLNEVLWVGRVDSNIKRIDYMIDIWKAVQLKHPNWVLRILGNGPSLQEMKDYVKKNNIQNIRFEGRVVPDTYYDKAKILCVTSVLESFSLVTIEAKMHGVVPVVQDSFPIAREIVNNELDGILVKPFDQVDYIEKLSKLMCCDEVINKYSHHAIISSSKYSPECILALWDNLFKSFSISK